MRPEPPDEFQELLRQARNGDQTACQRLYDRYADHVLRVIRRRLSRRLRLLFDSVDLAQEVWMSVFTQALERAKFAHPGAFLHFLTAVACRSVLRRQRDYLERDKRSLERQVPFDARADVPDDTVADPASQANGQDLWTNLLAALSEPERAALESIRAGERLEEAARRAGLDAPIVFRLLQRCQWLSA